MTVKRARIRTDLTLHFSHLPRNLCFDREITQERHFIHTRPQNKEPDEGEKVLLVHLIWVRFRQTNHDEPLPDYTNPAGSTEA